MKTNNTLPTPAAILIAMTETERSTLLRSLLGTVEALTVHAGIDAPLSWKLDPSRGWVRS